ncbi:MAG: sensor histidine kinase [Planctomycetota bacterium]|jgi:C4-dicarboxylate-specific signal transduction histidine kinase
MTNPPSVHTSSESTSELPEAALAAHDIKNLLGAVIGHADLQLGIVHKAPLSGDSQRHRDLCQSLDAIRLSAAHAMTLCQDMLALADGRPQRLAPIDLAGLTREAVDLFSGPTADSVQVRAEGPATQSVHGHRTDLQRTLLNLMWNAFDAMDGQADKQILVRWGEEGGRAFVEVVDSGPGLPAGHLADLTRPFHSTKGEEGKVRGLGLHSAARVLRRHGGQLLGMNRSDHQGAILRLQFGLAPELDFGTVVELAEESGRATDEATMVDPAIGSEQ